MDKAWSHQKAKEEIDKYRYTVDTNSSDLDIVDFVPVEFVSKLAKPARKEVNKEASETESAPLPATKETYNDSETEPELSSRLNIGVPEYKAVNKGKNFIPVDLSPRLSAGPNNTNTVRQILSNTIPRHNLMPGHNNNMLSNSTGKFLTFVPVSVTTKKRVGGRRKNNLKNTKDVSLKEKELMKLLIAVENMTHAETRKTIRKRNREKRRRQKQRREMEKRRRLKEKLKNSVLPSDGFHASTSKNNFIKKKYYSKWVKEIILFISHFQFPSKPQPIVPATLPQQKKSSIFSQILASYKSVQKIV